VKAQKKSDKKKLRKLRELPVGTRGAEVKVSGGLARWHHGAVEPGFGFQQTTGLAKPRGNTQAQPGSKESEGKPEGRREGSMERGEADWEKGGDKFKEAIAGGKLRERELKNPPKGKPQASDRK